MKKIIILALLVLAVVVIPPYFIGSTVESEFRAQIAKANINPSYDIAITEYNKGWFSSQGEVEVTVAFPSKAGSPVKVKVIQAMQHGPILWQGETMAFGLMDAIINIELPEKIQAELDEATGSTDNILLITARAGFDFATQTQLILNTFTIEKDGTKVNVKPAKGHFSYDMNGHIEGALTWDGMSIKENSGKAFSVGSVTMDTKQRLVSGEMFSPTALFNGHFTANLSSFDVSNGHSPDKTSLQDVKINATSEINQGLAKITVLFGMKQLEAIQQTFKNIVYDMSFDNLDVEALKQMNQIIAESQGENPMMLAAKMQGLLPSLLAKTPIIKINKMGMNTQTGDIDSNMTITIDKDVYDVNNPMTMMIAVKADAQGYAPEAFFAGLGMGGKIEQMIQQKFLVRAQENIKFEFSFKAGQALLNGQPMPLGGM